MLSLRQYLGAKAQQYFVSSSCIFLDKKILIKFELNPGLNLIIFRGTGRKIVFHESTAKLLNPVTTPPPPPLLPHEIFTSAQDRKAWKRREVVCWHHW